MDALISPPSKIARFTDSAPSVGLGLGLGSPLRSGKSAFTFLQLQELEHQALIFKYMVAGVPVPFHLVHPIWKSFVSSAGGIYPKHYPSWLGCSSLCFDYRNSMEPEPGRCRRTDGKKWRCSKEVVPDQKYCERHIHRGRQRPRKPNEGGPAQASGSSGQAPAGLPNDVNSTRLSISMQVGLELMTSSAAAPANANATAGVGATPVLAFSPTSVLQSSVCKAEPSL